MTQADRQFIADLITPLATKEEVKAEIKNLATKEDLENLATKEGLASEIESLAAMTKEGFDEVYKHADEIKYRIGPI